MKLAVLRYICMVRRSKIELILEDWPVVGYPISFTPKECLEEFCESVGWEFLGSISKTFHCRVATDKVVMDTIYNWADNYRERAV